MTTKELKKKIGFQIGFLTISGASEEDTINRLVCIAEDYAAQFKYDYSKKCEYGSRIGETWCCNQCGLPSTRYPIKEL